MADKRQYEEMREIRDALSHPAVVRWISDRIVDIHIEIENGVEQSDYQKMVGQLVELRSLQALPKSMSDQLKRKEITTEA